MIQQPRSISDKTVTQKDTFTALFVETSSAIAKTQKQPQCPPTDEWVKMWHTHATDATRPQKGTKSGHLRDGMDPRAYHTEWSKSEKETPYDIIRHVESKIGQKWTVLWNRSRLLDNRLQTYAVDKWGRDQGGVDWDLGLADVSCYT